MNCIQLAVSSKSSGKCLEKYSKDERTTLVGSAESLRWMYLEFFYVTIHQQHW